ncbi:unnamed protein product [Strongylus vulgaris]|uniref:Glucuronosyltransferase n=1 Tax=Strongylus vulgaris TaxID=40348 RepID=A0A3P7JND7_STRVU|nr:unnamed protein product [Strongylus vulgaris]
MFSGYTSLSAEIMSEHFLMILFLVTSFFISSSALNILIIAPTLSYSHVSFNAKIADILSMILFLVTSFFISTSALNILIIAPTLSYSHVSFNAKIADSLSSKGHKVVLRKDVGLAPGQLSSMLWKNPSPYEDSSPLNLRIFIKLVRVSSLFVRACEGMHL